MYIYLGSDSNSSLNNFVDGDSILLPISRGINGSSLLIGKPRESQPYNSLNETGKTQLTETAAAGSQPRGFDSDWRFSISQGVFGEAEQFVLLGVGHHPTHQNSALKGLWRSDKNRELRLVAKVGMQIPVNGEERLLHGILVAHSLSAPRYRSKWVSRKNEIIFYGSLDEGGSGIFLLTNDSKEQAIFNLAEQLYPQFFSPANVDDQLLEGFVYRYYPTTNTYIGIKNGEVFVLGDAFGSSVQRIGTIENTLQFLKDMAGS